jgi:hypothetical protein
MVFELDGSQAGQPRLPRALDSATRTGQKYQAAVCRLPDLFIIRAVLTTKKTLLKFQHDICLWCRVGKVDGGANGGVEKVRLPCLS